VSVLGGGDLSANVGSIDSTCQRVDCTAHRDEVIMGSVSDMASPDTTVSGSGSGSGRSQHGYAFRLGRRDVLRHFMGFFSYIFVLLQLLPLNAVCCDKTPSPTPLRTAHARAGAFFHVFITYVTCGSPF
jgi:hypothetical protein